MFKQLKKVFTIKPVLAIPDLDKEMRVETNTSDYIIEEYCQQSMGMKNRDQLPLSQSH